MTITHLILDLDGPILDGKARHHYCYRTIMEQFGFPALGLDEYWKAKRNGMSRRELLARSTAETLYDTFMERWMEMIESPEALTQDDVQRGAVAKLKDWKKAGLRLTLATLRNNHAQLYAQLEQLDLAQYFDAIAIGPHAEGAAGKVAEVKKNGTIDAVATHWIGDTEIDWEAARLLNCSGVLVSNGVRSEEFLRELDGAIVVDSIIDVVI